jgi:3-oxoacyl-[acyl-carrier protein] reductase
MDREQSQAEHAKSPGLEGRRALVIGGTGGIGRAAALELGARGAFVIVHGGASCERLDSTLAALKSSGAGADGFLLKLESAAGNVSRFVDGLSAFGRVDILVVAFGPFTRSSLSGTKAADWERLALLDLALPGALCSALLPGMLERGWGRILLFGGTRTDTIRPCATNAAYASAKAGLAILVKSLAAEGAARNVSSVLACPGLVDTEYLDDGDRASLRAKAPAGRLFSAAEIAAAAIGLLALDPCPASGAIVSLDGGLAW